MSATITNARNEERKIMSRMTRLAAAAAATLALATGGAVLGTGTADAAPQLPRITTTGDDFGMFGDHDYCHGAVRAGLTSPKRGVVRITLTSHGFTGSGSGWQRNPHCGVLFIATTTSGAGFMRETYFPASFGRQAGQTVVHDVVTGSGVAEVGITPAARRAPVRALQGYGAGYYVLVP